MTTEANSHDSWRDSAALYAVGALTGEERRAFEEHLRSCADCTMELLTLRSVAATLAHAVPQTDPPAALKSRVMDAVTSIQKSPATVQPPAPATTSSSVAYGERDASSIRRWLGMAAMFLLIVGLAGYSVSLRSRVARLENQLDVAFQRSAELERLVDETRRSLTTAQTQLAVFTAPDATRIDLAGQEPAPAATGRADWSRSRGLALSVANLPALAPNRTYQVWLLTGAGPVSAGLLQPDQSGGLTSVYSTPTDVPEPTGVALSEEPEGGSMPLPTGRIYLVGLISRAQ